MHTQRRARQMDDDLVDFFFVLRVGIKSNENKNIFELIVSFFFLYFYSPFVVYVYFITVLFLLNACRTLLWLRNIHRYRTNNNNNDLKCTLLKCHSTIQKETE